METAVRKATRLEYQPPKRKHLDTLVALTFQDSHSVGDIMQTLGKRSKENSWIIAYKILIIVHVLMREGNGHHIIDYVYNNPSVLENRVRDNKSSTHAQMENIRLYKGYLTHKVQIYGETRIDQAKNAGQHKAGRLRHLSVNDGLLKETEVLQKQITSIMSFNLNIHGVDAEISLMAYRLVLEDLLNCFQALNEGIVNILEHYFAMSKPDAQRSLEIYKRFANQTEEIHSFLDHAKRYERDMNMDIPTMKHAPLSLAAALEEYLNDPNFESQQQNGTTKSKQEQATNGTPTTTTTAHPSSSVEQQQPILSQNNTNGQTAPVSTVDSQKLLVDFFGSLENEQATVFHPAPTGANSMTFIPPQPTGGGGNLFPSVQQPLATGSSNPFRVSTNPTGLSSQTTGPLSAGPLSFSTGSLSVTTGPLSAQPTGSSQSNPFRTFPQPATGQLQQNQSMFLPQQTTGWSSQQSFQQQPQFQNSMMTGASSFSTFPQPQQQQQTQPPQQQAFNNNIFVAPQTTGSHNPFL
ncbi:ANTH domain-containing protein [Phascolomyces articulosus]|uniref:ANTH domain-containing protein n=1 Tax=Phascolomyces articulosus TaxID=60185 RepID=A0AAD5JSL4_9FUNG|nr:ANTH domain-containing protein [Phascolomyces articulosus]